MIIKYTRFNAEFVAKKKVIKNKIVTKKNDFKKTILFAISLESQH